MKIHEVRIHLVKYGMRIVYIKLEELTIKMLQELILRVYKIEPESLFVEDVFK